MAWLTICLACGLLSWASNALAQQPAPIYQNDFSQAEVGKVPDDFLVLDGLFAVQQDGANKFLELPGAPVDSYGALFGPTEKDGVEASARIFATSQGRRFPTFAIGVNGMAGYRLQVAPAKKALELYRGETLKTSVPYQWESGKWTQLRLQIRKASGGWKIEGKAWSEGTSESAAPNVAVEDAEGVPPGRAGVFGSPFSGTPIRFDDLAIRKVADVKS